MKRELTADFAGEPAIIVMKDGHHVSRISDFIIYSVEAAYINDVVKEYGPCTSTSQLPSSILSIDVLQKLIVWSDL